MVAILAVVLASFLVEQITRSPGWQLRPSFLNPIKPMYMPSHTNTPGLQIQLLSVLQPFDAIIQRPGRARNYRLKYPTVKPSGADLVPYKPRDAANDSRNQDHQQ